MFDRAFVIAAALIGSFYVVLIWLITKVAGQAVAGVAGVALTALATGIFKQFETLRFKRVAEGPGRTILLPAFNPYFFALCTFAILGLQVALGFVIGIVTSRLGQIPENPNVGDFMNFIVGNKTMLFVAVTVTFVTYLTAGFLIGKTARSVTYTYAVTATLTAYLLPLLGMIATFLLVKGWAGLKDSWPVFLQQASQLGTFGLLYVFGALVGTKLGFRKQLNTIKAVSLAEAPPHAQASP